MKTSLDAHQNTLTSGGFPCQDISINGRGEGIFGERSSLWFEMLRIIRDINPRYIIIENSPNLINRGLEHVISPLSEIGYVVEWQCLSNSQFGFPHKRERLYIVAYPRSKRRRQDISQYGITESIFRQTPTFEHSYVFAKRIQQLPNDTIIRTDDGISNRSHRIKSLGNAMNPIIAYYLFNSILQYEKTNNWTN